MNSAHPKRTPESPSPSRRSLLAAGAVAAAAAALPTATQAAKPVDSDAYQGATKKRIRQSIMGWTFKPMPTLELAKLCKKLGIVAMEGISAKDYPAVKKLGLEISLVGSHGFKQGPSDPKHRDMVIDKLKKGIDTAKASGCERVITFTGFKVNGLTDKQMTDNCVNVWKEVIPYAEKQGIMLCLEHLNSRDDTHPMKGHPGYYGDDVDHCADMVRAVGSPNMKLLFDIYHVQIMNGDVIRRIDQHKDVIGHYHTAGNPGRAELDDTQEINYPPILRKIIETGYKGYVAQEFIPTWKDKAKALAHAVTLCDV